MKDSLSAILIEFRRYLFRRAAVSTLFCAGALLVAGAFAAAALDNLFGWSDSLRWLLWAALLSLPVGGAWRLGRSLRTLFRRSDRSIALELEGRLHIPGNALVNGVEFRRRTDLPESIRRVYAGCAAAAAEKREKFRISRLPELRRQGGMLLAAALLCAGYAALWPRPAANAFGRILMPWREIAPINRTEFRVEPGDVEIPYGGRVLIRASALIDGRPRAGGRVPVHGGGRRRGRQRRAAAGPQPGRAGGQHPARRPRQPRARPGPADRPADRRGPPRPSDLRRRRAPRPCGAGPGRAITIQ